MVPRNFITLISCKDNILSPVTQGESLYSQLTDPLTGEWLEQALLVCALCRHFIFYHFIFDNPKCDQCVL